MTLSPSPPKKVGLRTLEPMATTTRVGQFLFEHLGRDLFAHVELDAALVALRHVEVDGAVQLVIVVRGLPASTMVPPGLSRFSYTCTSWPRSAATHAHSRPAGPPPAMKTVFLVLAGCG